MARRKRSCTVTMEYRPIGAVSDRLVMEMCDAKSCTRFARVRVTPSTRMNPPLAPVDNLAGKGTAGGVAGFLLTIFYQGETHMFAKFITAGLVGSALLATVAFAQSPTAPSANPAPAAAASNSSFQGNWRASKLVGLNVYNDNHESIGAVNDLLTEKDGKIKAVGIGAVGFLV